MEDKNIKRLSKVAREFNVGITTIVEFLGKKGHIIDSNPNTKITPEQYSILLKEYSSDISIKKESEKINFKREKKQSLSIDDYKNSGDDDTDQDTVNHTKDANNKNSEIKKDFIKEDSQKDEKIKVIGKIDLDSFNKNKGLVKKKEDSQNYNKFDRKPEVKKVFQNENQVVKNEKKEEKVEQPVKKQETTEEKKIEEPLIIQNNQPVKEEPVIREDEVIVEKTTKTESPLFRNTDNSDKKDNEVKVIGKIDLSALNQRTRPPKKSKKQKDDERRERERVRKEGFSKDQNKNEGQNKQHFSKDSHPKNQQQKESFNKDKNRDQDGKDRRFKDKELILKKKVVPVKEDTTGKKEDDVDLDVDLDLQEIISPKRKIVGPTVVGKIELPDDSKKIGDKNKYKKKKKRKRINKELVDITNESDFEDEEKKPVKVTPKAKVTKVSNVGSGSKSLKKAKKLKVEVNEEDVQKQVKETLARLTTKGKSKTSKYRREKRDEVRTRIQEEIEQKELDKKTLKVTEFVSANELANMMNIHVNQIIATCMDLGFPVSINQRLDAETIVIVAGEFGYDVEFMNAEAQDEEEEIIDSPESLLPRAPIVTVMGHVDHGKTSLLDYIRRTNVIAGEAGGITQHIGAYNVTLDDGRKITFLDTPGHEAFTAMRARGAKITDIAIIVVSADDNVMPQTIEAINHAQAAGVPIIFAINKIDKPGANPEKIKEQLANMNLLVEDWGGKYGSVDISAKKGLHIEALLDRVLLEAEMLDLKANPDRRAIGTILEASLDKGRGFVATLLVKTGTLRIGDILLAGSHFGKVKAIFNERGHREDEAGPSEPALILGLDGAPQAGDIFKVLESEREAKDIAVKRKQIQREVGLRTQKHITLDEIGRRIAIGGFKEINLIVKGDVVGTIEALADSLIKLSTEEIQVNVIHKAVGQIHENDVMLAAASNAIIIGFQVRPSISARKTAETEQIDIRLYSIIYDAINDVKAAMEGMLSPEIKEEIIGSAEVVESFKITKVGTVAGCMVKEGKITRHSRVRVIRDGIVVYTGELGSLKRFKDDAKEVAKGFECGLNVEKYNDIKVGDFIEAFVEKEVKKTL